MEGLFLSPQGWSQKLISAVTCLILSPGGKKCFLVPTTCNISNTRHSVSSQIKHKEEG